MLICPLLSLDPWLLALMNNNSALLVLLGFRDLDVRTKFNELRLRCLAVECHEILTL